MVTPVSVGRSSAAESVSAARCGFVCGQIPAALRHYSGSSGRAARGCPPGVEVKGRVANRRLCQWRGQVPTISTVWVTSVKPASTASFSARVSSWWESISTVAPQRRQSRWWWWLSLAQRR